jgi:hypothetical protein
MGRHGQGRRQPNELELDLYPGESATLECNSVIQSLGDSRVPGVGFLCVRMGSAIQAFPI